LLHYYVFKFTYSIWLLFLKLYARCQVFHYYAFPADPSMFLFLCSYMAISSVRAGPRYFLGSKAEGFFARNLSWYAIYSEPRSFNKAL